MGTRSAVSLMLLAALGAELGCIDDTPLTPVAVTEVAVVVDSASRSLSLIATDRVLPAAVIPLEAPSSTPATVAARGPRAVVPLGQAHAAVVVDLAAGAVTRLVGLGTNSGATGAAFLNDSLAYVANPGRNTVTRLNVRTGDTANVATGIYPQGVAVAGSTVFVLNGNLGPDFVPIGNGSLTIIDGATNRLEGSIALSGTNSRFAALGADGLLYVVNAGRPRAGDGSLSVVDPTRRREVVHLIGLGESPGPVSVDATGRAFIATAGSGLLEVDTRRRTVTRGPSNGIVAADSSLSGVAVDASGQVWVLVPGDCVGAGRAVALSPALSVRRRVTTGSCPVAIAVTTIP